MKYKDLDSFNYLDSIQVACPEEFADASELPEDMIRSLYPHADLGPAFPQILQMHTDLHFVNEVAAAKKRDGNAILRTLLKATGQNNAPTKASHPIRAIHTYTRNHPVFARAWQEASWSEFQNKRELASAFIDIRYSSGPANMVKVSTTLSVAATIFALDPKRSQTAAAECILWQWNKCVSDMKELQLTSSVN